MIAIVTITAPGPVSDVIVTLTLSPETEAEGREWPVERWTPTPEPGAESSGHQTVSRSQYATINIRGISRSCGVGVGGSDQ